MNPKEPKASRRIAVPIIVIGACILLFISRYIVIYTERRYGWLSDMNPTMLVAMFTEYVAQPLAVLILLVYAAWTIQRWYERRSDVPGNSSP